MDVFWLVLVLISALLLHVIRKLPDQVGSETRNSAARARVFFRVIFPRNLLALVLLDPGPLFRAYGLAEEKLFLTNTLIDPRVLLGLILVSLAGLATVRDRRPVQLLLGWCKGQVSTGDRPCGQRQFR